jgi:hypothetical protein
MRNSGGRDIFTAWVAAIVSGTITLAASLFAIVDGGRFGSAHSLSFVDAALIFFLAYWVARQSRIAIVALIAQLLCAKAYSFWDTGSMAPLVGLGIFGYFYVVGAIAIFARARGVQHEA